MSVGVRRMINGLSTKIKSAKTMKVYGRLRASLTIHIEHHRVMSVIKGALAIEREDIQGYPLI
jgi:hypothetical protein